MASQENELPFAQSLPSIARETGLHLSSVDDAARDMNFIIQHGRSLPEVLTARLDDALTLVSADTLPDGPRARQQYPVLFGQLDAMPERQIRLIVGNGAINRVATLRKQVIEDQLTAEGDPTMLATRIQENLNEVAGLSKLIDALTKRVSFPTDPIAKR